LIGLRSTFYSRFHETFKILFKNVVVIVMEKANEELSSYRYFSFGQ